MVPLNFTHILNCLGSTILVIKCPWGYENPLKQLYLYCMSKKECSDGPLSYQLPACPHGRCPAIAAPLSNITWRIMYFLVDLLLSRGFPFSQAHGTVHLTKKNGFPGVTNLTILLKEKAVNNLKSRF